MALEGKVCVVTGSGGGIGRATALEMARQGAQVVVSDINDGGGNETVEQIRGAGGEATYVHADMQSRDEIEALMAHAIETFGRLDVLHNNAGVHETDFTSDAATDTLPEEIFDKVIDINLKAVWRCSRAAIPHLRKSGRGAIVNAGSTGSFLGYPMGSAYGSSKHAVLGLTKAMAVDFAPEVRVNCYCPAAIDTAMTQKYVDAAEDKEAIMSVLTESHLIPRLGKPEEVAKLVCFLASDDAAFITGAAYLIDGGSLAWRGTNS
jgi:NAD(P)-dependent dehydrogenase (short-subunit alcohol dehydrogenase family)